MSGYRYPEVGERVRFKDNAQVPAGSWRESFVGGRLGTVTRLSDAVGGIWVKFDEPLPGRTSAEEMLVHMQTIEPAT